jgi:hypothetical protein
MVNNEICLQDTLAATRRDFLLSGAGGLGMLSLGALLAGDGALAPQTAAGATATQAVNPLTLRSADSPHSALRAEGQGLHLHLLRRRAEPA